MLAAIWMTCKLVDPPLWSQLEYLKKYRMDYHSIRRYRSPQRITPNDLVIPLKANYSNFTHQSLFTGAWGVLLHVWLHWKPHEI